MLVGASVGSAPRIRALLATALVGVAALVGRVVRAQQVEEPGGGDEVERCLLELIGSAPGETTVDELRRRCGLEATGSEEADESAVARRVDAERRTMGQKFVITPHRPNYVLPYTYNSAGNAQSLPESETGDQTIHDEELKFQISLKFPLWRGLFSRHNDLLFGFTLVAWWQAYSGDLSTPFREIDYEPELFLRHYGGPRLGAVELAGWDVGIDHQSNGRGGDLSRTWDRLVGSLYFELNEELALGVRGWYRIPESEGRDENPGIYRYLGYGEARLAWSPGRHTVTAMVRPGTEKSSFELTWSFHLENGVRLYTQLFDGYGESLLDYDKPSRRFGLGLAVSDFL
jgi:phospholipase A1